MAKNIKEQLEEVIETAEKFKNAYFWSSPSSASERRRYEKKYSIEEFCFEYDGHNYSVSYSVECSCRNIYAKGYYTKDGKKTTLTTIKNIYNKL